MVAWCVTHAWAQKFGIERPTCRASPTLITLHACITTPGSFRTARQHWGSARWLCDACGRCAGSRRGRTCGGRGWPDRVGAPGGVRHAGRGRQIAIGQQGARQRQRRGGQRAAGGQRQRRGGACNGSGGPGRERAERRVYRRPRDRRRAAGGGCHCQDTGGCWLSRAALQGARAP